MARARECAQSLCHLAGRRIACAVAFGAVSISAHAYRPFDGTDADVVDDRVIEIELGPVTYVDATDGSLIEAPDLTLNVGLSSAWELVVDAKRTIMRFRASRDIETAEAAVLLKGMLREGSSQDRAGWSVATEFGALLPATNVDDEYGASAAVIASLRNEQGVIHLNAELARNRDSKAEIFSSVIAEAFVDAPVRPVAEVTLEREEGSGTQSIGALVGAIWERADDLSFDFAVRAIHEGDSWSYEGRIGLTWMFPFART